VVLYCNGYGTVVKFLTFLIRRTKKDETFIFDVCVDGCVGEFLSGWVGASAWL
jgi:hypothetical protein